MFRKLIIGLLCVSLYGCIITPNNDTEWTFPEIKGYLIDSLTNLPVENAIVFEEFGIGETIQSDRNGFFNFKAQKEFIKYRISAMDPPEPAINLKFEKAGYESKQIRIEYIKIKYDRIKPDTIDLKIVTMIKNVP